MGALDFWRERPNSVLNNWESLSQDVDRMFRDMDRAFGINAGSSPEAKRLLPVCDVEETEDEYHVSVDVPGIDKKDINIEVVGNAIRISGERKEQKDTKKGNFFHSERAYGKFSRLVNLPDRIKEDGVEATYDSGVLCLTLPKMRKSKTRHISIKAGKPGFIAKLSSKENKNTEE